MGQIQLDRPEWVGHGAATIIEEEQSHKQETPPSSREAKTHVDGRKSQGEMV